MEVGTTMVMIMEGAIIHGIGAPPMVIHRTIVTTVVITIIIVVNYLILFSLNGFITLYSIEFPKLSEILLIVVS